MPMSVFIQALGEIQGMEKTQKGVRRGRCHMSDLDFVGDLSAGGSSSSCDLPGALSPWC